MRKKVPLYILAQAQTCVPIPIPELKPCAQRILQTESSLFSSVLCYQHYRLFSTFFYSRTRSLFLWSNKKMGSQKMAGRKMTVDNNPEHCILVAGGCSNSGHLKPDIVPKLFVTSNSPTGFCSFGF